MIRIEGFTFALLIAFIVSSLIGYGPFILEMDAYLGEGDEITTFGKICTFSIFINLFVIIISMIGLFVWIAEEEIGITIKLPHFYIQDYFRKKKELAEKKDALYQQLFNATTEEEIDLINKKLEYLDNN